MSDKTWVLRGVDAEARQAALAEAERRELSLSDYLTEVLLGEVLAGQLTPPDEAGAEPAAMEPPARSNRENFAFRHRVEALERRLTASLGGLDGALQALDSTVLSLTAQLDDTGALAEDGAVALLELREDVAALRKRLCDAEENAETLLENTDQAREALAERCAALEGHLTAVEAIAYSADAAAARLATAQEALQQALAHDFSEFAEESERRIGAAQEDMRALAEDAAAQADAAAQRAIEALRLTRQAMEESLADHAQETRTVVHDAFADAAERIDALADRVLDNQRIAHRMGEQLNARINNLEDAAHTAIEDAAETLRGADAALGAEIARVEQDQRAAAAQLQTRQDDIEQRIKLVDFALNNAIADASEFHNAAQAALGDVETVAAARHDQLSAHVDSRLQTMGARIEAIAEAATHDYQMAVTNIDRVEACTFAALEKLSRDIAGGDANLAHRLDEAVTRLQAGIEDAHNQHAASQARLTLIDKAVSAQDQAVAGFDARITRLEDAAANSHTEGVIAALSHDVNARLAQIERNVGASDASSQLEALRERVTAQEAQISESADRAHSVARMLSRVTAQSADAAAQTDERLHRIEIGMADMRLELVSAAAQPALDAVQDLAAQVDALEQRQAEALDALRADIAHFIGENDRRLRELERGGIAALSDGEVLIAHAIETRLTELEQRDVAAEFDTMRRRIEERILGVESRSIRALEQIAETVGLIEKRYLEDEQRLAQSA
jgi:predicted  nucleic acid-binding Zn-ribbon protein